MDPPTAGLWIEITVTPLCNPTAASRVGSVPLPFRFSGLSTRWCTTPRYRDWNPTSTELAISSTTHPGLWPRLHYPRLEDYPHPTYLGWSKPHFYCLNNPFPRHVRSFGTIPSGGVAGSTAGTGGAARTRRAKPRHCSAALMGNPTIPAGIPLQFLGTEAKNIRIREKTYADNNFVVDSVLNILNRPAHKQNMTEALCI